MVNTFHPIFVHFPIALLIVAGIIALIDLLVSKYQLKKVVLWNLIFAALLTIITVFTGEIDADAIPHNHTIHEIMNVHEQIGITILIFSIILSTWLIFRISKMKKLENVLFVFVLYIAITLVFYNGYLGGRMVYDYGAGVKPMQKTFSQENHNAEDNKEHY